MSERQWTHRPLCGLRTALSSASPGMVLGASALDGRAQDSINASGRGGLDHADVVIVGAGIVGLSAARALAGAGARVVVLDRGRPGAEASWAAAGWLAAQAEAEEGSPLLPVALRARELHSRLARELQEETGIDVGLSRLGTLEAAFREDEELALRARLAWQRARGLAVEWLGPGEVRQVEPNVNPAVRAAIVFPEDRCVDNVRLTWALAASAVARGAALLSDRPVTSLAVERGRVVGVKAGQDTLSAP